MRWRVLFWLSLVVNLILAIGWLGFSRQTKSVITRLAEEASSNAVPKIKTLAVERRQFFAWQELESDDYPTYVKNLRGINCPEQTIRDIIIADVNALYARRRALEIVTADQQWWRADPDTNVSQLATARSRELDKERRDLLTTLLGAGWEGGDLVSLPRPTRVPIPLDGPILGSLPNDVKQSVEQIAISAADRIAEYTAAQRQAGKKVDPAEITRIRQEMRRQLAGVLTAPQLEEYLLRYSETASGLRSDLAQLKTFNATPDEFRAMFRSLDQINDQLSLVDDSTPQGALQRDTLLAQGEAALKLALGEKRYEQYRLLHDSRYRDALAEAQQAGTPEAAATIYAIKLASDEEQARIKALSGLTEEQRALEAKKAELEQLKANVQALGQDLPPEPPKPVKPPPAKTHVVANGEGLIRISQIYGVAPNDLRAANPNINFDKLKAGDQVTVPLSLIYPERPR